MAFLKTHKTASSTVQNILFRFAENHKLTVALPIEICGNRFCYPQKFSTSFVHPRLPRPNIIASHMRFNKLELKRLMPEDTIYITILREPSSMFESAFTYFYPDCHSFQRVTDGKLKTFLGNPWRYYQPKDKTSMLARNTLAFDLGLDKDRTADEEDYVKAFLADMEKVFSLVMIAEYFDESLVLLRRLLSWDLDDIVYVRLNMRGAGSKQHVTPDLASKIRTWNSLDARLYDHFNASLWQKMSTVGLSWVAAEVQLLKQAREKLTKRCFQGTMPRLISGSKIQNANLRPWSPNRIVNILGYNLPANFNSGMSNRSQELCLKLITPELQYSKALLQSQLRDKQP